MKNWIIALVLFGSLFLSRLACAQPPLIISMINRAADVADIWNVNTRREFAEAMSRTGTDAARYWLHGRTVVVAEHAKGPWRLIIVDHDLKIDGEVAGGYHEHDANGPFAIINIANAIMSEGAAGPFLYGSHEIQEMIANPNASRSIHGHEVEITDPVVCCHYDLTLADGAVVPINDFVLPSWFNPIGQPPYDFIDSPLVTRPFQLGPDGY